MRSYADDVNLHARIHAKRGRLLSMRDYVSAVRERQAMSFNYRDPRNLTEVREELFREQIAPVIGVAEAYDKYAPLFRAYLLHFEAQNAKILLAGAYGRKSLEQWYDIGSFAVLEKGLLQKNLSSDDIKELINQAGLGDGLKDTKDLLRAGISLDINTVRSLYHASSAFSGQDKQEFQEITFRRLAVLTVIWSYRLKAYYRWSDEKIHSWLETIYGLFDGHQESQVRIVEEELNRHLAQARKDGGRVASVMDIEHHLEQNYYNWISFMFHRDFHSVCCVVAYLWLLFYQIKNLFRVIDGLRFGLPVDAILGNIICNE